MGGYMTEPDFDKVEDTLFIPILGITYACENFPHVFADEKALELKKKLPKNPKGEETQTQYTFLASAARSANMDRYVQDFLNRKPEGVIVQLVVAWKRRSTETIMAAPFDTGWICQR